MRISDTRCSKCGCYELNILDKGENKIQILCSKCGKFIKWANKDEKRLIEYHNEIEKETHSFLINPYAYGVTEEMAIVLFKDMKENCKMPKTWEDVIDFTIALFEEKIQLRRMWNDIVKKVESEE